MILNIITIIANITYLVVMNLSLYTDRAVMPNGQVRTWQRSPVDRLNISDQRLFLYLELFFITISAVTALLLLFGVKSDVLKKVRLISFIGSTLLFIVIMIITSNTHVKYA